MSFKIMLLLVTVVFFIGYAVQNRTAQKSSAAVKVAFGFFAVLYGVAVFLFTFAGRDHFAEHIATLTPFKSYQYILEYGWWGAGLYAAREILGNILMFLPLGIILCVLLKNKTVKQKYLGVFLVALAITVCIELLQYATKLGTFEMDDILHNTLGALIGCSIYVTVNDRELTLKRAVVYLLPLELFALVFLAICAPLMIKDFKYLVKF